jgi:hypothetical protein
LSGGKEETLVENLYKGFRSLELSKFLFPANIFTKRLSLLKDFAFSYDYEFFY